MEKHNLSPFIRVAMYDVQTTHFVFDRTIWDYEIIYLKEGNMYVTVDDKRYACVPGDFILLKPNQHHILESGSKTVIQPHVHFDLVEDELSKKIYIPFITADKMNTEQTKWFREDIMPALGINLPTVIRLYNSFALKDILLRIIDEFNYASPYSEIFAKGLLLELIAELARSYNLSINQSLYGTHYQDLEKITKYIYDNVDRDLSLDDLSNYSNISKFYLSRLFKQAMGISPYKYITQVKFKKTKELLQFTNLSMNDIALRMSFPDQQTFSRWFKKIDGNPPIKYRMNKRYE